MINAKYFHRIILIIHLFPYNLMDGWWFEESCRFAVKHNLSTWVSEQQRAIVLVFGAVTQQPLQMGNCIMEACALSLRRYWSNRDFWARLYCIWSCTSSTCEFKADGCRGENEFYTEKFVIFKEVLGYWEGFSGQGIRHEVAFELKLRGECKEKYQTQ